MTEERLLEEYSRLNNELVDARRELVRVNGILGAKERFLERILALSPDILYVRDLVTGRNEYMNRQVATMLGYGPGQIAAGGDGFQSSLMHPEDAALEARHLAALAKAEDGELVGFEYRLRSRSGDWRWMASRETVFERDGSGAPRLTVGIVEDVTDVKRRLELLADASLSDALTGIGNRRGFEELAEQQLRVAARNGSPCAIVFLDLDRFKSLNDSYGHAAGDEALKAAAAILRAGCRTGDIVARLGGDEFVAFLPDTGEASVLPLIGRLAAKAAEWNAASGRPWKVEFSAGYSVFRPESRESLASLVARADAAMYAAKKQGKGPPRA